jgi:hypothetical protein
MGGMNPIVNLQVYQPPKPKPKDFAEQDINKLDASMFLPTFMANPYLPPQWGMLNAATQPMAPIVPTIVKNFNINTTNPVGMHEKFSYIFEDMLPTINIPGKITTLKERNSLQHYLRSIFFPRGDGEDINLDERGHSLMQYLNYMDMNPYNTYNLEQNPYKSLPENFLIYRSCYPIQKDKATSTTKCAANSIGMNLRIHKLDNAAYNVHKPVITFDASGNSIIPASMPKYTDFEQWREIKYYEYIREHIIKKNRCPNFVNLFGYYINEKSEIDFDKINNIIKGLPPTAGKPVGSVAPFTMVAVKNPVDLLNVINNPIAVPTAKAYFGKTLIALTEAPLYNLLGFSSTIYARDGSSKVMTSTGFYNENVWYSVLFQLAIALLVLQKEEIFFNNFEVEHNVFVKNLSLHSNLTNFWKYKVNNAEYYVPNYGFTGLIDANFRNDVKHDSTITTRIIGKPLGDTNTNIGDLVHDFMFKKVFDPSIFNQPNIFINRGGIKPPPEIMTLLNKIQADTNSKDIIYYIQTYFQRFLNNRIGTYLKELEIPNIRRDDVNLQTGQVVVHEVGANTYKFVLIKKRDTLTSDILTKNDNTKDFEDKVGVSNTGLYGFSKAEIIEQTFKANEISLNEDELLETYVIA